MVVDVAIGLPLLFQNDIHLVRLMLNHNYSKLTAARERELIEKLKSKQRKGLLTKTVLL